MITDELEPTFDNIHKTILDDPIKRNEFLFIFYDLLNICSSAISISLDELWGSGKTYAFSSSSKADLIIQYFIYHKNYNIFAINEVLEKYGLEIL